VGRRFIISLGFHEDRAIRRLMVSSASKDDEVFAVTASAVPAVVKAFESLAGFCKRVGLPEPKLVEVPPRLYEGVVAFAELIQGSPGPVILDLSGGMRYLAVLGVLALFLTGRKASIYIQPESEGDEIAVPESVVGLAYTPLQNLELAVLRAVSERGGLTADELAGSLGRSPKTAANAVARLQKLGLVVRRGRTGGIYTTEVGKLALVLAGGRSARHSS
jgi:CRISPR locus-related DNA-binding protein